MEKLIGLVVATIFLLSGPTSGQLCDPDGERIDCGKFSN